MRHRRIAALLFAACWLTASAEQTSWHDARDLTIEGKGWSDTKNFYDRLPARAEKIVRPPVWSLSRDSAGISVRFLSDATNISARWVLRNESLSMAHMPASGVSGVDLYVKENGKWKWLGAGRPKQFPTNEVLLAKNISAKQREFILYLPLYNGVSSVEIGIPAKATIEGVPVKRRPIVFYGTSILQGGCASRPGLAYPSILGRHLDWPVINLGFSGNAWSEPELAEFLAELDPVIYVLDPLPNMKADGVRERIEPFVKTLRQAHPKTPIVFVENLEFPDGDFVPERRERYESSNTALREVFQRLVKSGEKNISYITAEKLIGDDGEGTVDGTHPNDIGFMRMAEKMEKPLRKLLK